MPADALPTIPPAIRVDRILGQRDEPLLHAQLHRLAHDGEIDIVRLAAEDLPRRRLQITSAAGRNVQIGLARAERLQDGAVLWLDEALALVVQVGRQLHLRLTPRNAADALALGYQAGNLHWPVEFAAQSLILKLRDAPETYLERLRAAGLEHRFTAELLADRAKC